MMSVIVLLEISYTEDCSQLNIKEASLSVDSADRYFINKKQTKKSAC